MFLTKGVGSSLLPQATHYETYKFPYEKTYADATICIMYYNLM